MNKAIVGAALSGFVAVAIGAFGAHGVADPQAKAWIVTGSQQHMAHTLAIFVALWVVDKGGAFARFAVPLFFAGHHLVRGQPLCAGVWCPARRRDAGTDRGSVIHGGVGPGRNCGVQTS
jgi:uncharacterized membrane protein YgdD (TMEM256/DUF423 family)